MKENIDLAKTLRLYAITNREWENDIINLQLQIELAIAGGVSCVAIQEPDLIDKKILPMAKEIREICDRFNIDLVIHDRIDIAIKSKANGICISHNSDLTIDKIRCKLEKAKQDMFIGVTIKSLQEAIDAQNNGADYIIARGVFQNELENPHPISTSTLRQICETVDIPVIASGGITKKNISQLNGIGIIGTGLKTSIFSSENIKLECEAISQTLSLMLS